MKLRYTKINHNTTKFFYEGEHGEYGEFYLEMYQEPIEGVEFSDHRAEIIAKDKDYAKDLICAFTKAMLTFKEPKKPIKEIEEEIPF